MEVNEKAVRSIFVVNAGKFNFDFDWTMKERAGKTVKMVTISPESGSVPCNDRRRCVLAFKPPQKTSLRGCELLLKVRAIFLAKPKRCCKPHFNDAASFLYLRVEVGF